jgi:ribosomal protein S20
VRARFACGVSGGGAEGAGSFFFPLDVRLSLGTEGYSPAVLAKAVRQATKASSFSEASDDLRELADVEISPTHLQRLSERIGEEWAEARDEDVEKFHKTKLERSYQEPPRAAAVMLDGGRLQTRADGAGRGVSEASWRESKVACCLTLQTKAQGVDPEPEPPSKFLEPTEAARLASGIKRRSRPAEDRDEKQSSHSQKKRQERQKRRRRRNRQRTLVRTVVATMENSEVFGWQVAAEVHRRGLDRAKRKGCICDGQAYNWSIYEMHLLPAGFIAILDFLHLLAYLYDAAHAYRGSDAAKGWKTYVQWLRLAWSGKVGLLLSNLRAAAAELATKGSAATARKETVDETLTYVRNNRRRMDYPEYRRLGLPISSAPVESTIKQINRRVKGSEKFWLEDGAEAILQLRAAQLSQDDRWKRNWQRPRKHRRAAGSGRLAQAA